MADKPAATKPKYRSSEVEPRDLGAFLEQLEKDGYSARELVPLANGLVLVVAQLEAGG